MTRPEKIVVIDDNPSARYSTSRILRAEGMEVAEAGTGTEGIELIDKDTGLVVLDINLPDIDGFEVCRRLRAHPEVSHIPIVHLSATFVEDSDKAKGLEGGADGYLTHPVEPIVLVATVNALLRARRAEEATRRSEQRFRAVFETAPSGIALMTAEGIYIDANPAMCRLLDRTRDELVGMSGFDLLAEERQSEGRANNAELLERGNWTGVVPIVRKDGSTIDVEWNAHTFSPGKYLLLGVDVTDKRRADAEREQLLRSERAARAEAERANRTKDDFLATLSHELRSPLHVIVGWAGVLTQLCKDPSLLDGLEAMERSADVLARLIADLLDVARITAGKLNLNTELVDLASVVDAAIAIVTPSALAKQVRLERALPDQPLFVTGDPSRLQQVSWNLLANAIKFTPRDGVVEVSMRAVGGDVELKVSDTGRGIAPGFLPHIFERFRQESAGGSKSGGLGLGLAIVKHLVEMHGGVVRAESAGEGRGATFTVLLPIEMVAENDTRRPGSRRGAHAPGTADLSGLRVLVVDDDPGARAPTRRILSDAGAQVAEAGDVTAALDLLESFQPGVLLSDIGMSEQDGYDLIREVRKRGFDSHNLPALAITAFAAPEDRTRILDAGYQMHLPKPVDARRLLLAISALTGRSE